MRHPVLERLAQVWYEGGERLRAGVAACRRLRDRVTTTLGQAVGTLGECARFVAQTTRWALGTSWGRLAGLALLLYLVAGTLVRYSLEMLGLAR